MTIGSVSTLPPPPLSAPPPSQALSTPPADRDSDGGRAPEAAGAQAADAGSGLPFDPARGRNVNITT